MLTELSHTDEEIQYAICVACANILVNGLDSVDPASLDEDGWDRVSTFLDDHMGLTQVDSYNPGGYWDCEMCDTVMIGDGYVFETGR